MNTKTTKFLAVLAVLAMAFAGLAVISPASQSDAAEADIPVEATAITADTTLADGGVYTLAASNGSDIKITVGASGSATLYIASGMTATITGATGSTMTITPRTADAGCVHYANGDATPATAVITSGLYALTAATYNADATGTTVTGAVPVASIVKGDVTYYYPTLQAAIADTTSTYKSITMLKDVTLSAELTSSAKAYTVTIATGDYAISTAFAFTGNSATNLLKITTSGTSPAIILTGDATFTNVSASVPVKIQGDGTDLTLVNATVGAVTLVNTVNTYGNKIMTTSGTNVTGAVDEDICIQAPTGGTIKVAGADGGYFTWTANTSIQFVGYKGSNFFVDAPATIDLSGENSITLTNKQAITFKNDVAAPKIKTDDGTGTLAILIKDVTPSGMNALNTSFDAIETTHAGAALTIDGVGLAIQMTLATTVQTPSPLVINGIEATTSITANISEFYFDLPINAYSIGLNAPTVSLTTVDAGLEGGIVAAIGIKADTALTIVDTALDIEASIYGIEAGTFDAKTVTSVVEIKVTGGYYTSDDSMYGLITSGTVTIDASTVIAADSWFVGAASTIKSGSVVTIGSRAVVQDGVTMNVAGKVINNGTMIIDGTLSVTGTFENNGTVKESSAYDAEKDGPITLLGSFGGTDSLTNASVGNNITVTYDKNTKTYSLSGTLKYWTTPPTNELTDEHDGASTVLGNDNVYGFYIGYAFMFHAAGTAGTTYVLKSPIKTYIAANDAGTVSSYTGEIATYNKAANAAYNDVIYMLSPAQLAAVNASQTLKDAFMIIEVVVGSTSYYIDTSGLEFPADDIANPIDGNVLLMGNGDGSGDIQIVGGTFENEGTVSITSAKANFLKDGGKYVGDLTSTAAIMLDKGTFEGDLTTATVTMTKDVTMKGDLTITGTAASTIYGLTGDLYVKKNIATTLNVVSMKGKLVFAAEYNPIIGDSTKATFSNTLSVNVNGSATTTFNTIPGVSGITEGTDGYVKINAAGAVTSKKTSTVSLTEGRLLTPSLVPVNFTLIIDDGRVDIARTGTNVLGAMLVKETITPHMYPESGYGRLSSATTYNANGYNVWANVTYAFENATGQEILISSTPVDPITANAIAEGTTVILAKGVSITLAPTSDFVMGSGASVVFQDINGKVIFGADKAFSGKFVYGDNIVILKVIQFTTIANNNSLESVAATSTVPASIKMIAATGGIFAYDAGSAEVVAGVVTGSVSLDNVDATSAGTFILDEGTKAYFTGFVTTSPDAANTPATTATIAGVLDLTSATAATSLSGIVNGEGAIVIGTTHGVTLGVETTYKTEIFTVAVVDVNGNGYVFDEYKPYVGDSREADNAVSITATAATGSVPAYVKLDGTYAGAAANVYFGKSGTVTGVGNVYISDIDIAPEMTVLVDDEATMTVSSACWAEGLLLVLTGGTLNQYTTSTTTYAVLNYDVTFATNLGVAYSGIAAGVNSGLADEFVVEKDLTVKSNMTVDGVTILINDDVALTIANGVTVFVGSGNPEVGEASIIAGKIVLGGQTAVLVVYANGTVDTDNIATADNTKEVVYTEFDAGKVLYAMAFAYDNNTVQISAVGDKLDNEFDGYRFVYWTDYKTEEEVTKTVGKTNVYAYLIANQYSVTIHSVTGVIYKIDGMSTAVLDTPVDLPYGTVVNAVADYGYQGTTQSWIVTENMQITATGFAPMPEPTPEEQSEWTINTILLCILVVLIAIMAVIVALRLNRG